MSTPVFDLWLEYKEGEKLSRYPGFLYHLNMLCVVDAFYDGVRDAVRDEFDRLNALCTEHFGKPGRDATWNDFNIYKYGVSFRRREDAMLIKLIYKQGNNA